MEGSSALLGSSIMKSDIKPCRNFDYICSNCWAQRCREGRDLAGAGIMSMPPCRAYSACPFIISFIISFVISV